jgi:hypothetical protein
MIILTAWGNHKSTLVSVLAVMVLLMTFFNNTAYGSENSDKCKEYRAIHKENIMKYADNNGSYTTMEKQNFYDLAETALENSRQYCAAYAAEFQSDKRMTIN